MPKLIELVVHEISLVDKPANPFARVTLFKRADALPVQEVDTVDTKELADALAKRDADIAKLAERAAKAEATAAELADALAKRDADVAGLTARSNELAADLMKANEAIGRMAKAQVLKDLTDELTANGVEDASGMAALLESLPAETAKAFKDRLIADAKKAAAATADLTKRLGSSRSPANPTVGIRAEVDAAARKMAAEKGELYEVAYAHVVSALTPDQRNQLYSGDV